MGNLYDHAEMELKAAGLMDKDSDYDGMLGEAVLELVDTFAAQGHSGMSAGMTVALFGKVASFEPLGPLTGEDDEWNAVTDNLSQNRRCSHVFKEDGVAYDGAGKVFREPNGCQYTNRESRVPITFPYTPKTEYVDVPARKESD